ncbi:hypothetical protein EYV94_24745 [Puteibacter caeruleilacunae]|nr:hypothetical protein EYV94_24745 [Puteibacter caeruleilacunae]
MIDEIDDPSIFYGMAMRHPYSSYIHPESNSYHFKGIVAAYMIEFILARDLAKKTIKKSSKSNQHFNHAYVEWYYLKGGSNLVVRNANNQALTCSDIKALKQIYSEWWELNKDKTIVQLREAQLDDSILKDTQFISHNSLRLIIC